jgi:hypothetical protein
MVIQLYCFYGILPAPERYKVRFVKVILWSMLVFHEYSQISKHYRPLCCVSQTCIC